MRKFGKDKLKDMKRMNRKKRGEGTVNDLNLAELRLFIKSCVQDVMKKSEDLEINEHELLNKVLAGEEKILEQLKGRKSWLERQFLAVKKNWKKLFAVSLVPFSMLISEGTKFVTANIFDRYDLDKVVLNTEDLARSADKYRGACLYGANGDSAYAYINNYFSRVAQDAGYPGIGYCRPVSGAVESVELTNNPTNPQHFGITQSDVPAIMEARGQFKGLKMLKTFNNVRECAVMPTGKKFKTLDDLISHAKKAADGKAEIINIALKKKGSGSYETAKFMIDKTLPKGSYKLSYYNDETEVSEAVLSGAEDVGIVVEYPGRIRNAFHGALKTISEKEIPMIKISNDNFSQYFAQIGEYDLANVKIEGDWSYGFMFPPLQLTSDVTFEGMLCTKGTSIVAYDEAYIDDPYLARDIRDRNRYIEKALNEKKLSGGSLTKFEVISRP